MSKQKTEDRGQRTEDRRQRTENRRQRTEDRRQKERILNTEQKLFCILYSVFCCLLSAVCCLLIGCERFYRHENPYKTSYTPEKVHEIKTLELQKTSGEQKAPPEVNEVNEAPPKELELTLEQCRSMTLANNLDLKVQLINPSIAAEKVSEQEAQFEAAFYTNSTFSKTDTPVASFLDEISGSQVSYFSTDLGVQVPLKTGGTVTFDLADSRADTGSPYSVFDPSYSSDLSVSISQPLLRGAGRRANTYVIRIAEYEKQITDAATKLEVIRVLADVDRVYWRLYAARRELDVRKQQYELADLLYKQAVRFVNAGEKPQIEITRTEAGVAQRLEAIIIAENNVRDRERDLKQTLNKRGLGMQTPTVLIPSTEPDPVHYKLDKKQLIPIAMDNRMEMLELELQIAEDFDRVDYMRNQALPLVTMDYRYNVNGLGASRDDSYDLLFDKRFEDHRAGLQLVVPLGNEAAKSRLRQAFYQRRQRLASRDNREALIKLEVLNAIDQLEANWQRVLASRQTSILDGRLYEAEKRQFELGLGISTEVLEAQTDFAEAQRAEILALAEYQIALVDLAYATGTLLGAAKVRWEPIVLP
jgi:outer membrane protein